MLFVKKNLKRCLHLKQENIIELKNITKQYEDNVVLKELKFRYKKE